MIAGGIARAPPAIGTWARIEATFPQCLFPLHLPPVDTRDESLVLRGLFAHSDQQTPPPPHIRLLNISQGWTSCYYHVLLHSNAWVFLLLLPWPRASACGRALHMDVGKYWMLTTLQSQDADSFHLMQVIGVRSGASDSSCSLGRFSLSFLLTLQHTTWSHKE